MRSRPCTRKGVAATRARARRWRMIPGTSPGTRRRLMRSKPDGGVSVASSTKFRFEAALRMRFQLQENYIISQIPALCSAKIFYITRV